MRASVHSTTWIQSLLICALALIMCRCERPEVSEAVGEAPVAAPEPISVPGPGQVYRYLDPADGAVKTASAVEAIPEGARDSVVVFDAKVPTPPGWEQVVNLSKGTPAQTTPTQGFVLRPTIVVRSQGNATAKSKRAGHEVVMFSTQGCGYCRKARAYFKKHGVAHSEYDVERDPKAGPKLAALAKEAGVPVAQLQGGVPLIFINGKPHVGFDQAKIARLLGI